MPTTLTFPPLTLATLNQHMVEIEGGTFEMGGESWLDNAKPIHTVKVSAFALCRFPVTQALWQAVMGNNPSHFYGWQRPVETVAWSDCQLFLEILNRQTNGGYRFPSEAEWEYAARGGVHFSASDYAGSAFLGEAGWYRTNSLGETQPVGLKRSNPLGLYDMSGNIWEWCQDHYHNTYDDAPADSQAWEGYSDAAIRVYRGGSWDNAESSCRIVGRNGGRPGVRDHRLGFRLARSL